MKLSIVIPCFNSENSLSLVVEQIFFQFTSKNINSNIDSFEVVLVDDGSSDQTSLVAANLANKYSEVKDIVLQRNFGQHAATIAGIRAASGEIIVTTDDDLQHPASEIHKLIQPIISGDADLVYAVPLKEEHGFFRSFASRSVKRLLQASGVSNATSVGSFRAFRSRLKVGFEEASDPFVNLDVLLSWTTTRVSAVKVEMPHRQIGSSNYSFAKLLKYAGNMITGYGVLPLQIATYLGIFVALVGVCNIIFQIADYFSNSHIVEGYTSIVSLICLFSGTQLLMIGVIGQYLGRVHFRTMRKPMYLVRKSFEK